MNSLFEPLVSIIINCHNGQEYLKEALDSVYTQTYKNWEIIFWDNASTDNSKFISQSYDSKLKYFFSSNLLSLGRARNLAVKEATGKYITFLDTDDYYLPNKLADQVHLMESSGKILSYSGLLLIDTNGKYIGRINPRYKSGDNFRNLLRRYEINMPAVMLQSDVLRKHHLKFDVSLKFAPDYHLFMHIAALYPIDVIKDQLLCYRRHENSLSKKSLNLVENEQKYVLDSLKYTYSKLYEKYRPDFNHAYKKLCIARAKLLIAQNEFSKARRQLLKGFFSDKRCIALFFLLCLPEKLFTYIVKCFRLNIPISL